LQVARPRLSPSFLLGLGLALLVLCLGASILAGITDIGPGTVLKALTAYDGSALHHIIRHVRLPRALIATMVGASLAVAGAIMQALTRNPLASPGVLGINAGAAFFVVIGTFLLKTASLPVYASLAFLGAGLTALLVFMAGSLGRGGLTPLGLTVAGAALTALLASLTQAVLVTNERTLDEMRFWLAGSVADRDLKLFLAMLPLMLAGLLGALLLARPITTLAMGEDVAKGLGQRTAWVKAAAMGVVVLLAGASVAVAGPISFVGLAVPHITRGLVGPDYRRVLPHAALHGAILLLLADVGARLVIRPNELPVGVMTALCGAPFFIYLARRGGRRA
jgi:iron complex transport system permease protein